MAQAEHFRFVRYMLRSPLDGTVDNVVSLRLFATDYDYTHGFYSLSSSGNGTTVDTPKYFTFELEGTALGTWERALQAAGYVGFALYIPLQRGGATYEGTEVANALFGLRDAYNYARTASDADELAYVQKLSATPSNPGQWAGSVFYDRWAGTQGENKEAFPGIGKLKTREERETLMRETIEKAMEHRDAAELQHYAREVVVALCGLPPAEPVTGQNGFKVWHTVRLYLSVLYFQLHSLQAQQIHIRAERHRSLNHARRDSHKHERAVTRAVQEVSAFEPAYAPFTSALVPGVDGAGRTNGAPWNPVALPTLPTLPANTGYKFVLPALPALSTASATSATSGNNPYVSAAQTKTKTKTTTAASDEQGGRKRYEEEGEESIEGRVLQALDDDVDAGNGNRKAVWRTAEYVQELALNHFGKTRTVATPADASKAAKVRETFKTPETLIKALVVLPRAEDLYIFLHDHFVPVTPPFRA